MNTIKNLHPTNKKWWHDKVAYQIYPKSFLDTNGDGKITDAEISAFTVNSAKQEKMDEFRMKAASNMSTFYGSDSSDTSDTYSILSYKYKSSS